MQARVRALRNSWLLLRGTWEEAKVGQPRDGELRHARYRLNVPLRAVRQVNVNEQGDVVEV